MLKDGYFWAVSEGKLREISAVLMGANELTPTIPNKTQKNICVEINELREKLKNNSQFDENIVAELKNFITFVADITSKSQPSLDTDLKKPININNLSKNFKLNLNDKRRDIVA